ncbi:hypothetical protein PAMP_018623 [Pampus punctatissimus]
MTSFALLPPTTTIVFCFLPHPISALNEKQHRAANGKTFNSTYSRFKMFLPAWLIFTSQCQCEIRLFASSSLMVDFNHNGATAVFTADVRGGNELERTTTTSLGSKSCDGTSFQLRFLLTLRLFEPHSWSSGKSFPPLWEAVQE